MFYCRVKEKGPFLLHAKAHISLCLLDCSGIGQKCFWEFFLDQGPFCGATDCSCFRLRVSFLSCGRRPPSKKLVFKDVFIQLFQEDGNAISVQVVREGGSLVTRYIEYFTTPGDPDEEFYGGIGVLKFEANENYKEATLIARTDGVPEVFAQY